MALVGTVKAWIEARGMGFIAPSDGTQDVFVHRTAILDGNSLSIGASVTFESSFDEKKGKPIARNVSGGAGPPAAGGGGAPSGSIQVPGHAPVAVAMHGVDPGLSLVAMGAAPSPSTTQLGTVKAWLEEKGYGFVTPDDNTGDIFVHRSALQDGTMLIQGGRVQIEASWDASKGKPIASRCVGATNASAGGGGASGAPMSGGTVKVWFEDKGFGFISPDDGSADAFVHRCALQDGTVLATGAKVWFEAQWNAAKQKLTATKVVSGGGGAPSGGGMNGGWDAGGAAAGGAADGPSDNLFIAGLPKDVSDELIRSVFGPYGEILQVRILPDNGKPDGAALVRFSDVTRATWIVENLNMNMPVGLSSPITVKYKKQDAGPAASAPGWGAPAAQGWGAPPAQSWGPPPAQAWGASAWGAPPAQDPWAASAAWGAPPAQSWGPPPAQSWGPPPAQSWGGADSSWAAAAAPAAPADNLFIGGLPVDCDEAKIQAVFGPYGQISSIKMLADNGRPDKAALVRFAEVAKAQWIVENLNMNMPVGLDKPIQVKFAASQDKGAGKGQPSYSSAAAPQTTYSAAPYAAPPAAEGPPDNLFIGGLPVSTTEETLKTIFGPYGSISSCKVLPDNGREDRAALVRMADPNQAKWLVDNLNQNIPVGLTTPITVRFSQSGGKGGGAPPASFAAQQDPFAAHAALAATAAGGPIAGTVKAWKEDRGMGFITPSTGGQDLFVHRSQLVDGQMLTVGASVTFTPGWDAAKNKAIAQNVSGAIPQA